METAESIEVAMPKEPTYGIPNFLKPFRVGERLPPKFPHLGPNGNNHKGNLVVTSIDGDFADYSGYAGWRATAQCPLKKCNFMIEVKAIEAVDNSEEHSLD